MTIARLPPDEKPASTAFRVQSYCVRAAPCSAGRTAWLTSPKPRLTVSKVPTNTS